MPNIALVWDFDGTLTPHDSTTKAVEILQGDGSGGDFWKYIKSLHGRDKVPDWQHILASDAPIWMYALSRVAFSKGVPLNSEFFREYVVPKIILYKNVIEFLQALKDLTKLPDFKKIGLEVHHFIVTAGLKELVEQVFPPGLITWSFGCRYTAVVHGKDGKETPESIPVFCMDETMKTRSLFEISKGVFLKPNKIRVNTRIEPKNLWAPFADMVYVGDGDTDVPSLSLVRDRGGLGIAVFDPNKKKEDVQERLKNMRLDKRADLITPAVFSLDGELFNYLKTRCIQIKQRYEAAELAV